MLGCGSGAPPPSGGGLDAAGSPDGSAPDAFTGADAPAGQCSYGGQTHPLGASFPDTDFPMYLRWHQEGKFPLDRLITRRYGLEQINEACHDLHAGEILGRAILEY